MSWQTESISILRILINDFSATPTYDDSTLEQLLLVAARYVVQEINLSTSYTVDVEGATITPDPSDDLVFLNFMILKAACLTNTWSFNSKAIMDGITAKCGPTQLSVKSDAVLILGLLREGPCKAYEELKMQHNFGNADIVRGILSPFVSNTYLPTNQIGYARDR